MTTGPVTAELVSAGVVTAGPVSAGPVTAGPVCASPVTSPPGATDFSLRSSDRPLVTIQTAATNTAIPTTPAAMRWFRLRRLAHAMVFASPRRLGDPRLRGLGVPSSYSSLTSSRECSTSRAWWVRLRTDAGLMQDLGSLLGGHLEPVGEHERLPQAER